jgi:hypothetical protein
MRRARHQGQFEGRGALRGFIVLKTDACGTIKKIADGEPWTMPATIDDPMILDEIGKALEMHGVR